MSDGLLFLAGDDATVSGIGIAVALGMAEKSLEERVAALEEKVGEKSIAEQLAEHGRLIDRALAHQFAQQDRKWDARLRRELEKLETRLETKLERTLDAKFDVKLAPIHTQLSELNVQVKAILSRLS